VELSAPSAPYTPGVPSRPAHWRWNFAVLGGDIAFFTLGLNISSAQTILPLFVQHLTTSNEAVALIAAVRALGIYAPQLLVARSVERLRVAKPLILFATIFERVPFLLLGLGALWLAGGASSLLLGLFFVMVLVQQGAGGITYPPWLDFVARAIPSDWRGRFLGWWSGVGGLLGIGGAAVAALLLARLPWPFNFALIFGLTFVAMIVSFVLLALGREPPRPLRRPDPVNPAVNPARLPALPHGADAPFAVPGALRPLAHARELLDLLRDDRGLRNLVIANAAAGVATMGGALFAIAALRQGGLSTIEVGAESTVLVIASTAGNFVWGTVGDRFGHRSVLIGAALCSAAAASVALLAHGVVAYSVVFLLLGLNLAALFLSQLTFISDLAPPARRPTYIALTSVAYAPFAVGAPILAGWIADHWGYTPVFIPAIVAGVIAALIYHYFVPQPGAAPSSPTP
jgi:MFS family permease